MKNGVQFGPQAIPESARWGVSGEHYRAGYEAGYALGLRLGQKDRRVFEGTSIIIPADSQHDARFKSYSILRQ